MALTSANPTSTQQARRHAHLPPLIRSYLERALPPPRAGIAQIRITQSGTMWSRPGARPMHFTASERFAVERIAFRWEARFRVAPGIALRVRDAFDGRHGELGVRALGIPVQRRAGTELAVAEAYRYLAELPWVPQAMAANRELEWAQPDDRTAEVSCRVARERLAVTFEVDASGDIVRCSASDRPRDLDGDSVPTAWGGELSDYRTLGGIRLPTLGEVYWELPAGRFMYWRGRITGADALREPFMPRARR